MSEDNRDRLAEFIAKNKQLPPSTRTGSEESIWLSLQMTKRQSRPWRAAFIGAALASIVVVVLSLNQDVVTDSTLANIQAVEESLEMEFLDSSDFPLVSEMAVFVD